MTLFLQIVSVAALGGITGVAELVSRYRDEPVRVLSHAAGLSYVGINAAAAAAALVLIHVFDWRFGLSSEASTVAVDVLQVLVAGTAAAALFRTSLFSVKVGDETIGVGPSAILDVLLAFVDRSVDRIRGVERLALVGQLPSGLSFERDAITLTRYALASLQNLSAADAEWLGHEANALKLDPDLDDEAKLAIFALDLLRLVGERGLQAAIQQLTRARHGEHLETSLEDSPPAATSNPRPHQDSKSDLDTHAEGSAHIGTANSSEETVASRDSAQAGGTAFATKVQTEGWAELQRARTQQLEERIRTAEKLVQLDQWDLPEVRLELARARALVHPIYEPWSFEEVAAIVTPLEAAISKRPAFADAYLELGRIHTVRPHNHTDEAVEALSQGLSVSDGPEIRSALLFQRAVVARRVGEVERAADLLEEAVREGRADPDMVLAAGAATAAVSEFARATLTLVEWLPPDGGARAQNLILSGLIRHADGHDDEGAPQLAEAANLTDSSWLDWDGEFITRDGVLRTLGQGLAHYKSGEYAHAVEIMGSSLRAFLPGCESIIKEDDIDLWGLPSVEKPPEEEAAEKLDIHRIAERMLDALLITRLGQPVPRGPLPVPDAVEVSVAVDDATG